MTFISRPGRPPAGLGAPIGLVVGLVVALALALAGPALAAPKFPALTGRVVDDAHVLTAQAQADLTSKLAALETQTTRQLVVVTLPSLQGYDIADFGYQLGRAWGIGQKASPGAKPGTEKDNGVLFIVAPSERSVRIEVGYGLEGVLTDALSSVILQTQVLPKFRAGDTPGGITAGTDALITQLGLPPDQAAAVLRKAEQRPAQGREREGLGGLLPLLFILFVLFSIFRGGGRGGGGWILPIILSGLASRGGRDDDWGGGGGGFGGGGGGFGGGGGSFGGGGASGRW